MRLVIAENPPWRRASPPCWAQSHGMTGIWRAAGTSCWCFGHLAELADAAVYNADDAKWTLAALPIIPTSFRFIVRSESRSSLTFCGS